MDWGRQGGRAGFRGLEVVKKGGGAILLSFLPPQTWELFLCRAVARDLGSLQSEGLKDGERPLGQEHPAVSVPETGVTRVGGGCFCILGTVIRAFAESG